VPKRGAGVYRGAGAAVCALLLAVLLANACGFLLQPTSDPDFFWHLRTGEWIREHRSLPGAFLFAAAPQHPQPDAQRFVMTSYWLAQVLLATLREAGGPVAIVAWRFLLFLALLLLLAQRMRGDALTRLGLLSLAVPVLGQYPPERPQFLSFVFAAALLLLLDGLREARPAAGARWRAVAIPPLMTLWANCHGGFVVGVGLLCFFAVSESLKALHGKRAPLPPERLRTLLAGAAGGILASLANPNGWAAFRAAGGPANNFIREYRSTIEGFRATGDPWIVVYWAMLALVVVRLGLSWRKLDPTALGLVLSSGYLSFTTIRHIPFFVVVALPLAAAPLPGPRIRRTARGVAAALGLGAGTLFLPDALQALRHAGRCTAVNDYLFPIAGADFIEQAQLQGNLFNHYDWGGYLLWRLAPRTVFIDGRNPSPELQESYRRILAGDRRLIQGEEFWKASLAAFDMHSTITPFFNPLSGRFLGLIDALLADPGWVPVFASPTTVIFAENTPRNREVVLRHALSRPDFYHVLLDDTSQLIADRPGLVQPYVARGELLLRLGDRSAAAQSYEAALRVDPSQPVARQRLAALRGSGAQPSPAQ